MPGEFNFEGGSNVDPSRLPPWRIGSSGLQQPAGSSDHERLQKELNGMRGQVVEFNSRITELLYRVCKLESTKILEEPALHDEQDDYDPLAPGNKVWEKISGHGPFLVLQEWKRDSRPPAVRVDLEEPGRSVIQQIDLDDALVVQDKKGALLIRAKSQLTPIRPAPEGLAAFGMALRRMPPGLWSLIVSLLAIVLASVAVGSALL